MALTARDVLLILETSKSFMFGLHVVRYGRPTTRPAFVTNKSFMKADQALSVSPPPGGHAPAATRAVAHRTVSARPRSSATRGCHARADRALVMSASTFRSSPG